MAKCLFGAIFFRIPHILFLEKTYGKMRVSDFINDSIHEERVLSYGIQERLFRAFVSGQLNFGDYPDYLLHLRLPHPVVRGEDCRCNSPDSVGMEHHLHFRFGVYDPQPQNFPDPAAVSEWKPPSFRRFLCYLQNFIYGNFLQFQTQSAIINEK